MFTAEGTGVYGHDGNNSAAGYRVLIATAESESWAQTIVDALNADPDAYVV